MGPAYLLDVVGLDPVVHSEPVMAQGYPQRMAALENNAMNILYQAGRLGQKTGKGFYDYPVDHRGRPGKTAADQTYALLKPHVAAMRDFSDEEIIDRMVIPMALETARCLEDGIVETAAAADTALILGLGFPRFRGGILRWMETQGLESVCAMADRYSALGGLYQVPENLRRLAENGGGFYNN
jgi:3-hydroxyacyl-CoA dehydrogenase/enoyl-CoA hydratase/3-hydroxybutyryl-CoA epimerase/enoyl-CoA isomerase